MQANGNALTPIRLARLTADVNWAAPAPRDRSASSTRRVPTTRGPANRSAPSGYRPTPPKLPRLEKEIDLRSDAGAISLVIAQLHKLPDIHARNQQFPKAQDVAGDYNGAVTAACQGLIGWIFERNSNGEALLCDSEKSALLRQLGHKLMQFGDASNLELVWLRLASAIKEVGTPDQKNILLKAIEDRLLILN